MSDRHIVAFGGGGFSDGRGVTPLDRYALSLIGRPRPRVCFVPTASGDAAPYIERFYAAFTRLECEPSHLSLFQPPYPSLPGYLASKDLIYVGAEARPTCWPCGGCMVSTVLCEARGRAASCSAGSPQGRCAGSRAGSPIPSGSFERSQMDSVFFPEAIVHTTTRRNGDPCSIERSPTATSPADMERTTASVFISSRRSSSRQWPNGTPLLRTGSKRGMDRSGSHESNPDSSKQTMPDQSRVTTSEPRRAALWPAHEFG